MRSQHSRMHGLATRLVAGPAVEDVLQDAYVKAYRAFPPSSEENLVAWLSSIVYRSCLDALRSARRRPTVPMPDEAASTDKSGSLDDAVPVRLDLEAAFSRLSTPSRATVVLVDVLGFDYAAAARILGTSRGTVASRLHAARGTLRQHLPAYEEEARTDER